MNMENIDYLKRINDQVQGLLSDSLAENRESFNIGFDI